MSKKIVISGNTGRLGRKISQIIVDEPGYEIIAGLNSSNTDLSIIKSADLVIDVTRPEISGTVVEYAVAHGVNTLVGTSGWSNERIAELKTKINGKLDVGVAIVPNFSLGSVLATWLAVKASKFYNHIEIIESHHQYKVDSPSGTSTYTAEQIANARQSLKLPTVQISGEGQEARGTVVSGIPVHSIRMAGVLHKQEVILGGTAETVTITHNTLTDDSYIAGIRAALPAAMKASGVVVGLGKLLGWDDLI